jgi:hypothetical protein
MPRIAKTLTTMSFYSNDAPTMTHVQRLYKNWS